jgi:hypothetical protein
VRNEVAACVRHCDVHRLTDISCLLLRGCDHALRVCESDHRPPPVGALPVIEQGILARAMRLTQAQPLGSCQNGERGHVMKDRACAHMSAIESVKHAQSHECEECVKVGSSWVHLRICQSCGVTLCCDSSPNRHASKHARASNHPVIASAEPGERWLYCFPDDAFVDY